MKHQRILNSSNERSWKVTLGRQVSVIQNCLAMKSSNEWYLVMAVLNLLALVPQQVGTVHWIVCGIREN
jgi:hypothetical protein